MDLSANKEYQAAQEKKWELERAVDALNEKDPYLAACAVWEVTDTLLITLCGERANFNPHLLALREFLRKEWA